MYLLFIFPVDLNSEPAAMLEDVEVAQLVGRLCKILLLPYPERIRIRIRKGLTAAWCFYFRGTSWCWFTATRIRKTRKTNWSLTPCVITVT